MKNLASLFIVLALSGCTAFGGGIDRAERAMTKQLTQYCAWPYYRRYALYIIANGALEQQKIRAAIFCPGDPVD